MDRNKYNTILIVVFIFFIASNMVAQTTGKIAGKVTDKETGNPLPAANIIVEGTDMGAAADEDGEFYIINVRPGTYDVTASVVGYSQLTIEGVRVSVNSTTNLQFEMRPEAIAGETVTVTAEEISVRKDQTSSIRKMASDELESLPLENLEQAVELEAGVVDGHFRGGRDTEVTYLIDGISINNVFNKSSKSAEVEVGAVQELEVITGTFNAEYGRAMSGVVNMVTKEGAQEFHGSISSRFANYITAHDEIFPGLMDQGWLTRNLSQDYRIQLEGPIFSKKLSYFINYRHQNNNGYLNGINLFRPTDYSEYVGTDPEQWHTESTGDSSYVSMERLTEHNLFAKLTYRAAGNLKLNILGTYNDRMDTDYDHDWKYSPLPLEKDFSTSYMAALTVNQSIGNSSFYEAKLSINQEENESYVYEDPVDERYVSPHYQGSGATGFNTGGMPGPGRTIDTFWKASFHFDYYWQLTQNHGIKTGIQATQHRIDRDRIVVKNAYEDDPEVDATEQVVDPETGKITFPNYAPVIVPNTDETLGIYTVEPYEFSGYIQDKMEYDQLVINLGLRYDYFYPNHVYPTDRRNPGNQLNLPDTMMSDYPKAPAKTQLSPRLGLAYQLGEEAVLRFGYGHFFQMPPLYALYQNELFRVPQTDYAVTMGNALLNAEKTVSYEIGYWQALFEGMSLEVALYYKDIYNLLSTRIISTYNQIEYGLYTNKDYGNSRGLEVKWKYQIGGVFANVNYTLAYTKGNADNPTQTFNRAGESRDPITQYIPMPWDQLHTLNLTSGYSARDYGFTITAYYNSGQPYTFEPLGYSPLSEINLLKNNDRKPSTFSMDLTSYYSLPMFENYDVRLVLNIYNLLDNLNAQSVYNDTGKPYETIIPDEEKRQFRSKFTDVFDQYENPAMYVPPRQVKLGLRIQF